MSNPFADAVAELEKQPTETAMASQRPSSFASTGNPFADAAAELEAAPAQEQSQPVQGGGTPDNPFSAVITFGQKIQEARQVGQLGLRESALGHAVAAGHLTLEEAEAQINADNKLAEMSGDLDAYEKESYNNWLTGIATSITFSTVKSLPMLEESLKPAGIGAALGGGAAAATGAGAPFALPVAGMTGTAVAAGWAADMITGQEYLQRRREGIPHNEALAASNISGIVQGMLQGFQIGKTGKIALDAGKNIFEGHMKNMAEWMINNSLELGKFGAFQIAASEAQTATRLIADAIAGTISKTPNAIPTIEEAVKEFGATFQESLKQSIGFFAGGKAVGAGLGLTGKSLVSVLRRARNTHIKNQTAKLERITAAEQQDASTVASTVDSSTDASGLVGEAPSTGSVQRKLRAARRLEKRLQAEAEINRIFSAADSLFTIDKDETRLQETNRIQRLVKRMISNSDRLDDKMKVKLLKRVPEIDGVPALLKMGSALIEEMRGREFANELKAAETRLKGAIKKGQPKEGKAVLPAAAQQSLTWYDEFFSLPKQEKGMSPADVKQLALERARDFIDNGIEKEIKLLQEQVEKLEQNKLADIFNPVAEASEKMRIATEAAKYFADLMTPDEIHELAESIERTVDTQKSEFLERKQKESARLLEQRAEVLDGVQGSKPVTPSTSTSAPKQMTGIGQLLNSLRRNSSALWDKLLQDTPSAERESLVRRILDFTEVENREAAINIKAAEKLTDLYAEAVGSIREANRLIKDGAKNERFAESYTDAQGKSQILGRHTLNELVYLHMAFEDPGAIPGLVHGNKYTLDGMVEAGETSTQTAVRDILASREGGKYLALADSLKEFYSWFAPIVGNHYLKEYGVKMPINEGYSGQLHHREVEKLQSAADILEGAHSYVKQSLNPASTKARSNSKLAVREVDPFMEVQRHRSQMAFWIANSEKARQLSFIFSDSKKDGLRDVIQHKLGKEFTGLIDGRLAFQFHLKPGIMDIGDRAYQKIKGNMATGLLGMRPDQAPKQMTSILAALSTNNYAEFVDGLRGAADKKRLEEYISRSELYKERTSDVLSQVLDATKDRDYIDTISGDRALAIKNFGLKPVSWADGVASAIVGFTEYNRVRKNGGSIEEAVQAGDALVDRTQSSSRTSQKVPAEFKGGIANLSLAFGKQGIQMLNLESGAIRDFYIHKDTQHLARVARTIVALHTAQFLFQAINSVPAFLAGEQKEQEEAALRMASAALSGPYGQLPLIGFDVVYGALSGWKGQQEPRTIIGGLAGDSARLVKQLSKIVVKEAEGQNVDGEDWMKAFRSLASVASVRTGLPFWGLFKYAELGGKVAEKAGGAQ